MKVERKYGFTLVELLVVIAIIGVLMGLLLPAVQRARESNRRTTCMNNLRQLAAVTIEYEGKYKRIPGLFEALNPDRVTSKQNVHGVITWPIILLPQLEREDVYNLFAMGGRPKTYIPHFVCPSDLTKTNAKPELSYVANAGRLGKASTQKIANGPFINQIAHAGIYVRESAWRDGREYTLLYSENVDATWYDEIGWNIWTDRKILDEIQDDRMWGPAFFWSAEPSTRTMINLPGTNRSTFTCIPMPEDDRYYVWNREQFICENEGGYGMASWARPSSFHSGGVNVAFSSGRVTWLRENVDYKVYIALMTPFDQNSDSPDPNFLLEDTQYQ